jgi:hypothetical protein
LQVALGQLHRGEIVRLRFEVLGKMVACNCQKNSSVAHIGLIDSSHCKQLCMQLADITQSIGSAALPTGSTAHIWWEIG